jgi:hypothetical protein
VSDSLRPAGLNPRLQLFLASGRNAAASDNVEAVRLLPAKGENPNPTLKNLTRVIGGSTLDIGISKQTPLDVGTASVIRITGGNFRLLNRLLTEIERILEITSLREVTKDVVDAARGSLVIGQA